MASKTLKKYQIKLALAISLSGFLGCGLLNEPIANFESSSSGNISSGAGCLRDSVETLGQYFSGTVSQVSITGAWACVEDSIDLFAKKVRGENPNHYTAAEIASFVESQVQDPGSKISKSLLEQLMLLKQVFVGGTTDRLTLKEMAELRNFAGKLKALFRELQPTMKILSTKWETSELTRDEIRKSLKSNEQLVLSVLKANFPSLRATYSINSLKSLADALIENFPGSQGLRSFQEFLTKYLPLIVSAKKIVLGSNHSNLEISDWPRLIELLPRLYHRFLHYNYLLSETDWFWGVGLYDTETLANDTISDFTQLIYSRGGGKAVGIGVSELNTLVESLDQADLLTDFFTPTLLKSLIPVTISRFFTPPDQRLKGSTEKDLSLKVLDTLKLELDFFFKAQKKLSSLWDQKNLWSHLELRNAMSANPGAEEELLRIFQIPASLAFDAKGRTLIQNGAEIPYDKDSAFKINLIRSFVRLMFRSYAKDLSRVQSLSHVTRDEVVTDAFTELRPILVEAELIAADNTTFLSSRFRESNLFTPSGNGDTNMDFREGVTISLYIWSGINLSGEFETSMETNCKTSNPELLSAPCALDQIRLQAQTVATNIPLMAQNLSSLPASEAQKMLYETLRATGWLVNPGNTAKMSDLSLVPHLLQYMESIYRRWDLNKDGILDKPEAMAAEPTFRPLLAELSGQTSASVLRAGFAYVLIYQKNPADDTWDFLWFMNDEASWKISVDRPKLSKVLGFIADEMAKP